MSSTGKEYSCRGTLTKKFASFLESPDLSDITIRVGSRSFLAHRFILGTRSDVLAKMMQDSPGNVLVLDTNATDKEIEVFQLVLTFLYTGEIAFATDTVNMVISLANRLSVEELTRKAQEWLGDTIENGSVLSALTWLRDAEGSDLHSLRERCHRILTLNFEYIPEASWLDLSLDNVLSILDQDDLVVENEEAVIKKIDSWLAPKGSYKDNEPLRKQYDLLASKIRLPFVGTYELVAMSETSLIVKYIAHSYPDQLTGATAYRSLCAELPPFLDRKQMKQCKEDCCDPRCRILNSMAQSPRLYLNFKAPGQRSATNIHGRVPETTVPHFKKCNFSRKGVSRVDGMKVFVQTDDGRWESTMAFNVSMTAKQVESDPQTSATRRRKTWNLEFKVTQTNQQSVYNRSYRIVIVARPLDAKFNLFDNPVVSTKRCSFKKSGRYYVAELSTLSTPPLFAGKQPENVEIAAAAYVFKDSTNLDSMEDMEPEIVVD